QDAVGVGRELGELPALRGEGGEECVRVPEDRVAPPDDLGDALTLAGEGGTELVEDEPEPPGVRAPQGAGDEIGLDAGSVLLQGEEMLARTGLATRDLTQRRR